MPFIDCKRAGLYKTGEIYRNYTLGREIISAGSGNLATVLNLPRHFAFASPVAIHKILQDF